jgi:hypothetical protein
MESTRLSPGSRTKLAALATAATLAGCGGVASQNCTVTLTGAQTGTYDCRPSFTAWDSATNLAGFAFDMKQSGTAPHVQVAIRFPNQPHVGDYLNTDAGAQGALSVTAASASWAAVSGGQGSYHLIFTSVAESLSDSTGKVYVGAGTVDATLPAMSGTGATGTVSLHVAF